MWIMLKKTASLVILLLLLNGLFIPTDVVSGGNQTDVEVMVRGLNFRLGPGTQYYSLDVLPGGTGLSVLAEENGWMLVRKESGETGWVAGWFTSNPEKPKKPEDPEEEKRTGEKVVGYYPYWAAYSDYSPHDIEVEKVTHINYAFANIGDDLRITMGDPNIDPDNFSQFKSLKEEHPHLQTLISVGGWTWSDKFSDVALTEASRRAFAESAVEFIVEHGFDGIDVDWEYPVRGGHSSNTSRPEDKQNFTLLLEALRSELDAQEKRDGGEYLLTIAGGAHRGYVENVELDIIHEYLDFANIMTYDIHATWEAHTGFNAPLYEINSDSPQYSWSVDSAVNAWLNAGFPAEKLVMGMPFYGYKYQGVVNANDGLFQYFWDGSALGYSEIADNYLGAAGFDRYFHHEAQVPWLFNGSTFISYEDEESLSLKAEYINSHGLAGAMVWELSHDPDAILLKALYRSLQ